VSRPELSVVVASHDRPLRLRWLLNALADQTLDRGLWEVVVCHASGEDTEAMLSSHPLAVDGTLRHTRLPRETSLPGTNRNAAVRLARAPVLVFTDDDCRPPREWLANVRDAVARRPGAIIQGPVLSDPDEAAMLRSPYPRTQHYTDVPRPWAECANIVYPAALVAGLGGFWEEGLGEDTDLNLRALADGAVYAGDPLIVTYHCIEEGTLADWLRGTSRWRDLPLLVKRHPEFRAHMVGRVFWKDTHPKLLVALLGLAAAAARRRPEPALAVLPWVRARPFRGGGVRGRLRHVAELPGYAVIDLAEMAVLARASARVGALLL
jgi:GT2 family glycosyltransferase